MLIAIIGKATSAPRTNFPTSIKGDCFFYSTVFVDVGLGTSTSKEAKEYFSDMSRHRIPFRYSGAEDDTSIALAFSKKCIEDRKVWLTNWMSARKTRQELGGCGY